MELTGWADRSNGRAGVDSNSWCPVDELPGRIGGHDVEHVGHRQLYQEHMGGGPPDAKSLK